MKYIQRVILLMVATAVFLTGMGVTVISFCCPSCSEQTLFMMKQHVCCAEEIETQDNSCCTKLLTDQQSNNLELSDSKTCVSSRISIDIDASSFRPQIPNPFVWLANTLSYTYTLTQSSTLDDTDSYTLKDPISISPRDYLSFIRILII